MSARRKAPRRRATKLPAKIVRAFAEHQYRQNERISERDRELGIRR
jgi:hypothetical protein